MARPLRVQAAGAHYHVGARGIDKARVFLTDEDHDRFLVLLGDVVERCGWRCHAYCLMSNHYHLALTTPEPNLGAGMRRLNQVYAQWFNHRHDRVGHLFEQRYWSRVLETEVGHVHASSRYIVANPVRAGLAETPAATTLVERSARWPASPPRPASSTSPGCARSLPSVTKALPASAPPPFGV